LPENFDWRNVGGYNFLNEHRNQGHCGSCYTVSFTQIAEQRLKLKYGREIPLLSPQFLMTCNYMNEGCDGGWPFFHGYLGEKGHLVTEECAPYQGQTKGDSCSNYSKCEPFAKVKSTYFIGRGYGDSSEKKMMKEILRNGIVNGELQAPSIFSMYTEGIMTSSGIQKLHKKIKSSLAQIDASEDSEKVEITNKTLKDYGISWQNLNHSVVIIGWGVDEVTNTKYWIVRNSYGSTWGDHGEFLVQRGNDDFGIESETTGYDYVLCSEAGC
jgi:cathepsin C